MSKKLKSILKNILMVVILFGVIIAINVLVLLVADDLRMQGQAEMWIAQQELVEYRIQPGDTWDELLVSAPDHVWDFELNRALREANSDRGYVSWTGLFHKTLITNTVMLVPADSLEALTVGGP